MYNIRMLMYFKLILRSFFLELGVHKCRNNIIQSLNFGFINNNHCTVPNLKSQYFNNKQKMLNSNT